MKPSHVVLAVTGASGAVYSLRLGRELLQRGTRVSFVISEPAFLVLKEECGVSWGGDRSEVATQLRQFFHSERKEAVDYYESGDFSAPVASGSAAPDAMIVCPCSMGTLSRIAAGNSGNLIERCADVMLKEGRPLVVVPRETPLHAIHLENMLKLARMGVRIIPPMPAFYGHPETIDDLIDFVVGKILDCLGIQHELYPRWGTVRSEPERSV